MCISQDVVLLMGMVFFLRSDNYLEKLPLFVAGLPNDTTNEWYHRGLLNKSLDGRLEYLNDKEFLKKCFIYTCLSFSNKCRSLNGSDGRLYLNELTFTDSVKTVADKYLQTVKLTKDEKELIDLFKKIREEIKTTPEYNKKFTYGTWQIMDEINIKEESGKIGRDGKPVLTYKYPVLNTMILELKRLLRAYYNKHLIKDLFKYELVK